MQQVMWFKICLSSDIFESILVQHYFLSLRGHHYFKIAATFFQPCFVHVPILFSYLTETDFFTQLYILFILNINRQLLWIQNVNLNFTVGTSSCTNHHLINRKVEMKKMPVSQNLLPPERQGFGQSKHYALECSPIKVENKKHICCKCCHPDEQIYFRSHSPVGTFPLSWWQWHCLIVLLSLIHYWLCQAVYTHYWLFVCFVYVPGMDVCNTLILLFLFPCLYALYFTITLLCICFFGYYIWMKTCQYNTCLFLQKNMYK